MKLKILLINFKPQEARACSQYLRNNPQMELDWSCCSIEEYEKKMATIVPEMVFIDIDNINESLHEITSKIKALSEFVGIVWVSDSPNRAGEAFDLDIDDYIVKPFQYERMLKSIISLAKRKQNSQPKVISIWENDRFIVLNPNQIIYCYKTEGKTVIKTKDGEYISMNTLAELEAKLGKDRFFRTHKSFFVNQSYIKAIIPWFNHTYKLVMDCYEHDEVPVSRSYLKGFKQWMGI